jgi:hypothetical protein
MLVIRNEQFEVFESEALNRHREGLLTYVRAMFPARCTTLSEEDLCSLVEKGSARAHSYGITTGDGVAKYLDVMFLIGQDFDGDPSHPWAIALLQSEYITDPHEKLELVYFRAFKLVTSPSEDEETRS